MAKSRLRVEDLINTIWRCGGRIEAVARELDVTSRTIRNYVNKHDSVKEALEDARIAFDEGLLDAAELKLAQEVEDGRAWAVKYVLQTKGRKRGYGEKTEVEIGGAVSIIPDLSNFTTDELAQLAYFAERFARD